MAAAKSRPSGKPRPKKGLRGKMPVKRSINLILVNEDRINPFLAALGIIIIAALAVAFGKFLVMDRLVAMSSATSRVSRLRDDVAEAQERIASYGEIEDTYAHYTTDDMTSAELGLVERTEVVDLVSDMLPASNLPPRLDAFTGHMQKLYTMIMGSKEHPVEVHELENQIVDTFKNVLPPDVTSNSWTISGNFLTLEVEGRTLERLNEVAQLLEQSPIVDSCTLTTANKSGKGEPGREVVARFIVYLVQAPAEEVTQP